MRGKWKRLSPSKKKMLKRYMVFWIVYCISFTAVEHVNRRPVWIVHCALDDVIPFWKYAVYFYLSWFLYLIAVQAWYFFKEEEKANRRLLIQIAIGLFPVILFYFIVPSGLQLRPAYDIGHDFTVKIVKWIWRLDSPDNVCPSIHVILSFLLDGAVKDSRPGKKRYIRYISHIIMLLIVLSTMLLKQHSVIDVLCGFGWGIISQYIGNRIG